MISARRPETLGGDIPGSFNGLLLNNIQDLRIRRGFYETLNIVGTAECSPFVSTIRIDLHVQ